MSAIHSAEQQPDLYARCGEISYLVHQVEKVFNCVLNVSEEEIKHLYSSD